MFLFNWKSKGETDLLLDHPEAFLQKFIGFKATGITIIYDVTALHYRRQILTKGSCGRVNLNSVTKLTENVIAEVEKGIEGITFRVGVVKCGIGYNQIHSLKTRSDGNNCKCVDGNWRTIQGNGRHAVG